VSLPWARVHLIALTEASRAHRALGIDTSRRIDPFVALERAGVLVFREPLDHLAGVYLPPNPSEGMSIPSVLINVQHPLSRQRFTAAHELAHHRRDQNVSFDGETEWLTRGEGAGDDRERIAEAFAAWFLMPKPFVMATLASLGLRADTLSAADAYALSLELGTSYTATVRHLVDMELLAPAIGERLVRVKPRTIKTELGALDVADDARRDVRLTKLPRPNEQVDALQGDVIMIEVRETPSSGYRWEVIAPPVGLMLVRDDYVAPHDHALGGRGRHRFLFRADEPGRWQVRLEMRRPWQRDAVAQVVGVEVHVEPQPTAGIVQPLLLAA